MRRLNCKTGIQQRLPDILGDDSGTEESVDGGTVPGITAWSIQAQMIRNFRRLNQAIVGQTVCGRMMKGLVLVAHGSGGQLTGGIGISSLGNVITIPSICDITSFTEGVNHFRLLYKVGVVESSIDGGLNTNIIGEDNSVDTVYDEYGSCKGTSINQFIGKILSNDGTQIVTSEDAIYLGYITKTGNTYVATPYKIRGFYPNNNDSEYGTIDSLKCDTIEQRGSTALEIKSPNLTGSVKLPTGTNNIAIGSDFGVTGDFVDNDGNTVRVVNGLIVSLS
jgi:hypothetical protein